MLDTECRAVGDFKDFDLHDPSSTQQASMACARLYEDMGSKMITTRGRLDIPEPDAYLLPGQIAEERCTQVVDRQIPLSLRDGQGDPGLLT